MSHGSNTDYSTYAAPQMTSLLQQRLQVPSEQTQQQHYPQGQGSPRAASQTVPSHVYNAQPQGMMYNQQSSNVPQSMPNFPPNQQGYYNAPPQHNVQYQPASMSMQQTEMQNQTPPQPAFHLPPQQMSPSRTPTSSIPMPASAPSPAPAEKLERAKSPGASSMILDVSVPLKPPKGPEKPLIPYLRFSKSIWDTAKQEHPGLQFAEIGKVIGEKWKTVDPEVKQKFIDEYNRDKEKYAQAQKQYLESAEYLEWLAAKNKREQLEDEAAKRKEEASKIAASAGASTTSTPNPHSRPQSSHSGGLMQPLHGPLEELQSMSQRMLPPKPAAGVVAAPGHVQVVQLAVDIDEDADDYLKNKHVCATRYKRNHRLMAEVFSDSIVPDGRMVVNEQRMALLRKQVQSLNIHQERLLAEQKDLVDKHEAKKRRLLEDSEAFNERWARVKEECKPVSKEQFQGMLDKYHKILEKMYADHHAQLQNNLQSQSAMAETVLEPPTANLEISQTCMTQEQETSNRHIDNIMAEPISSPPSEMIANAVENPSVAAAEDGRVADTELHPVYPVQYNDNDPKVQYPQEIPDQMMTEADGHPIKKIEIEASEPFKFVDDLVASSAAVAEKYSSPQEHVPVSPPKAKSPTESPKNLSPADVARVPLKKRHSLAAYTDASPSPSPPGPKRISPTQIGSSTAASPPAEQSDAVMKSLEPIQSAIEQPQPPPVPENGTALSETAGSEQARWFMPISGPRRPELDNLSDVSSDEEEQDKEPKPATSTETTAPSVPSSAEAETPSCGNYADFAL